MNKTVLFFLLVVSYFSFAQTKDELDLCMAIQANSFTSNTEAENALDRILDVIGASKNFVLTPCDKISNVVATAYKGTRYILYDREFMNLINRNTNDWSNLFILAHEVGHHINGHSIDILLYTSDIVEPKSLAKKRQQELEADEFAAFVLAKLGASLSQLNSIISLISDNSDDTYSTHPKRSRRLASVKVGVEKGYVKKETKTVYVDSRLKEYESSEGYVKYGVWLRKFNKDIFEGNSWEAVTNGDLITENNTINQAPLLKFKSNGSSSIIQTLEFENTITSIFDSINTKDRSPIEVTELILDSSGKELWRLNPTYRVSSSNTNSLESTIYLDYSYTYNKKLDALKKGTRFLIKINSYKKGNFTELEVRDSLNNFYSDKLNELEKDMKLLEEYGLLFITIQFPNEKYFQFNDGYREIRTSDKNSATNYIKNLAYKYNVIYDTKNSDITTSSIRLNIKREINKIEKEINSKAISAMNNSIKFDKTYFEYSLSGSSKALAD